ncbi:MULTISPECIES: hypothetical protein [unclassified Bartonella]|uniref:hypothetical protein n=1 Tax=unclassified Bartonella TaxID=2645622 RepID=UPI0035D0DD3B
MIDYPEHLKWQKIFNDLLIGGHMNDNNIKNKEKNLDISFQEDIVDCDDNDAVKQRIGLINGYLKSVVKEGWWILLKGRAFLMIV